MDHPPPPSSSTHEARYCYNPTLKWNEELKEYFVKAYGAEHFARISKALTHPSSYSCIRVNSLKSTTDVVIKKLLTVLHEKKSICQFDCANVTEEHIETNCDNGMVGQNFRETFKTVSLSDECGGGSTVTEKNDAFAVSKCPYPGLNNVVFVKGSGPHLPHYGHQSGHPIKELVVSRKCAESVLRGAQVFVPGVLACSSHIEKGDIVAVSVAIEQPVSGGGWHVGFTRGTVLQGLHTDPLYHERNGFYIGNGIALMSRAGIFRASEGVAVAMKDRVYRLPSLNDVLEGEIFLQNLPSIVTAQVLDPQQGERILDMCAAPGGKTTAIAILMNDKGEVVANDRSHNKVMDILMLASEMDLTCINACKLDALRSVHLEDECSVRGTKSREGEDIGMAFEVSRTNECQNGDKFITNLENCNIPFNMSDQRITDSDSTGKGNQTRYRSKAEERKNARRLRNGPGRNNYAGGRVMNSKGYAPDSFDRVLLDAPCSALGLRPRLFAGEETLDSLRRHAKYQRKMFDQAVQLVRPGGVLVYSTCTINPGENEALVRYALDTYPFLSLASQHPRIGGPGLVGHCELSGGQYLEEWLTESEAELVQRFDPSSSSLDTIGFFIAKFKVGDKYGRA